MLRRVLALFGFLAALSAAADVHAERRVALVVGNAHYAHANTLRNPINDASDIAELLKTLGFEVTVATDLDQRAFARQIDAFGRALEGADIALFFYAGHGLQVNEKNYLVATGARLENEFLIPAETIELEAVIRLMESRSRVNLVFLDACRNNPLADRLRQNLIAANRSASLGRGLARVEPTGRDTLIAFAAAPGQEATDGHGRNSPFTNALLKQLPKPGVEVSVMLKEVTAQVRRETNNAQRPQQLSDMSQTFYFAKAKPVAPQPQPRVNEPPPAPDHSIELAYWNSARSANDCESVRAYLDRYPSGIFSDLAKLSERRLCDAPSAAAKPEPPPPLPRPPMGLAPVKPRLPTLDTVSAPVPAQGEPAAAAAASTPPSPGESRVAALPSPDTPAPEARADPERGATGNADLVRDLQRELTRVGCSPGRPDGVWGSRSREALQDFNRRAKADLNADAPSEEALAAVQKQKGWVCPPEPAPSRRKRDTARARERSPSAERAPAATKDWRSISPLCESAYYLGSKLCCTYDPPGGAPQILCR